MVGGGNLTERVMGGGVIRVVVGGGGNLTERVMGGCVIRVVGRVGGEAI